MPKGSEELVRSRKNEILNACARLYETRSFKEITIKEIGAETTFGRTSVYNYFQTKEEIFLALLKREYELWNGDLSEVLLMNVSMTRDEFAEFLASSLSKRITLLKILSMNMYDIEENTSLEKLTEFKAEFGRSLSLVGECLAEYFPDMDEKTRQEFIYSFFPFAYGVYPYTNATEKQKSAMRAAGLDHRSYTVYELTYMCAKKLLGDENEDSDDFVRPRGKSPSKTRPDSVRT